jgi:hypothetical protein
MAIDLKLEIADLNEQSRETDDLLRALEGVPFNLDLLRAMTKVGFEAVTERGDEAIREEYRNAFVNFWEKRAEEIDAEEIAA